MTTIEITSLRSDHDINLLLYPKILTIIKIDRQVYYIIIVIITFIQLTSKINLLIKTDCALIPQNFINAFDRFTTVVVFHTVMQLFMILLPALSFFYLI